MTVKRVSADMRVFAADDMAGAACATALKKVGSLAKAAPAGRAFAAIATLTELSQTAEGHLTASGKALGRGHAKKAETEWAQATVVMEQMASEARGGRPARKADEPAFLRRK